MNYYDINCINFCPSFSSTSPVRHTQATSKLKIFKTRCLCDAYGDSVLSGSLAQRLEWDNRNETQRWITRHQNLDCRFQDVQQYKWKHAEKNCTCKIHAKCDMQNASTAAIVYHCEISSNAPAHQKIKQRTLREASCCSKNKRKAAIVRILLHNIKRLQTICHEQLTGSIHQKQ